MKQGVSLRLLACAGLLISYGAGAADARASSGCCPAPESAKPAAVAKPSCCPEIKGAVFSRDSIYQLDGSFLTDAGVPVRLGSLRGRPVLAGMFFASCTYACPMLLADMARIRAELPEGIREQVQLVLISFDTARDTPEALKAFRKTRDLDAGWTLLTAEKETVSEVAALLGVKYTLQADGQYAHSNLLTVLNQEGEIIQQRTGLKSPLHEATVALMRACAK